MKSDAADLGKPLRRSGAGAAELRVGIHWVAGGRARDHAVALALLRRPQGVREGTLEASPDETTTDSSQS